MAASSNKVGIETSWRSAAITPATVKGKSAGELWTR
jgi:hypothetical protein